MRDLLIPDSWIEFPVLIANVIDNDHTVLRIITDTPEHAEGAALAIAVEKLGFSKVGTTAKVVPNCFRLRSDLQRKIH